LASWVAGQLLAAEPYIPGPVRPLTPAEEIAQMAWQDAFVTWHGYRGALSDWQAGAQAEPPAPTPGAVEAKPTPAPAQSAASGGESKPGSDKHAETGNKSALAVDKLDQKAEPGRKTPPSGAAADPDKAAGQVTIIFKVTETVLQGGSQGEETKTVMAKFTAPEPALPKTGQTKTAKAKLDTGHDRSPVTCNTGADGRCKAQIPADEREIYGLPALPRAVGLQDKTAADADNDPLLEFVKAYSAIEASQNFGVELPPAKNTGMVIQSGPAKPNLALLAAALADLPPGVQVQKSDFKIGDKTYTRVAFTGPDKSTAEAARKFADRLGKDAQIDQCGEKAPGPPLGMMPVSFSALNSELPQTTVDLRKSVRAEGAAP